MLKVTALLRIISWELVGAILNIFSFELTADTTDTPNESRVMTLVPEGLKSKLDIFAVYQLE